MQSLVDASFNFFKSSDKGGAVEGNGTNEDRLKESDEFFKKWAGPMIIGAFVPALFALISIVGGTITLGAWTGQCGYPLQSKSLSS